MEETVARRRAEFLQRRVVEFCRTLRSAGMPVTPSETIDAIRAVSLARLDDRETFYQFLGAVLVKKSNHILMFREMFDRFWEGFSPRRTPGRAFDKKLREPERLAASPASRESSLILVSSSASADSAVESNRSRSSEELFATYSPVERFGKKDFRKLTASEIQELRRGLRRLAGTFATRPGRRYVPSRRGRLDFGRTLRSGISTGGEIVRVRRQSRSISKTRLVVLCDISGSMDEYSEKLIKILHFSQNTAPHARVYAFSTRLVELTPLLRGRSLWNSAQEISRAVRVWSSGTRIGSALGEFVKSHSSVLRSDTVLVIVSDGWEVGDVALLKRGLQEIRRRVNRIIWLNPLADGPGFSPSTVGMRAALPFIDDLGGLEVLTNGARFTELLRRGARQSRR